jgi:acetolactate synthase-1/2/3 large subunit
VIFVVINNGALANVWLRARREGPGPAGLTELAPHDWAGFARSLGVQAATVTAPAELAPAFEKALAAGSPYLVDVRCDKTCTTPVTPYSRARQEWTDND